MAKMYPKNIDAYNPQPSEKKVYEEFKRQLDDRITVFYSLSWITEENGNREQSEADFLIFDPQYGFLIVEVKGGTGIRIENNKWYLEGKYERELKQSPYEQAENSMRYFKNYYEEQYNFPFYGVYGAVVMYPNFYADTSILGNRPRELTIDYGDMDNLALKIKKAFLFWKGQARVGNLTEDQKEKFINLVKKRIAISAAAGALIEDKERQLEVINRVQDNYIYMLSKYNQFYMEGGAGTGKTCIAIKLAQKSSNNSRKVLLTCFSDELIEMFKNNIEDDNIDIIKFDELIKDVLKPNQIVQTEYNNLSDMIDYSKITYYDCIIVDEGQDFNEECAYTLRMFMKDEKKSDLYVFYDNTQNLYNRSFKNAFMIETPPFLLRENLRNTASIYEWATTNTALGEDVITNPIEGPKPESKNFRNIEDMVVKLEDTIKELVEKEYVNSNYITILVTDEMYDILQNREIGRWRLVKTQKPKGNEIKFFKTSEYKGLESNVVFYIKNKNTNKVYDYVAYTRAKFYLYEYCLIK